VTDGTPRKSFERDIGRAGAVISVVFATAGLFVNTGIFGWLPADWVAHGISPASFLVVLFLSASAYLQSNRAMEEDRTIPGLVLSVLSFVFAGLLLIHNCTKKTIDCDHLTNQLLYFAGEKVTDIPMAVCLLLLCFTAILSQLWGKRATAVGQYFLLPVYVAMMLSLTAAFYGLHDLMMFGMSMAPSPIEALVLGYVMVALVVARFHEGLAAVLTDDSAAGFVLRVLLPQGLVWPVLLGFLRLMGQHHGLCSSELGASLFTVTSMVFLVSTSVWAAGRISAIDLERRESESEMSRLNENLRAQIKELTDLNKELELGTLEAAKSHDLAIEASMQKAQFLSNMSHEIRTPMNGVLGMVEVLLRSQLSDKAREYSLLIRESAQNLLTVINDILDFSKIEAGKVIIEVTDFEPLTIVEDVAQVASDEALRRGITLMSYVEPEVPRQVQGDGARIRQVLSHLTSHALNGSGTRCILVKCSLVESDRFVAVLRFTVEDDGEPASEEDVESLFRQKPEGEATPSAPVSAGILGLSIARGLIDLMGGQIKSERIEDKNSFGFDLPVKISHAQPSIRVARELVGTRVLIVDDDFGSRQVLESYLTSWRLRCDLSPDPVSALGLLRAGRDHGDPFRLAIVDMRMPGMTGLELGKAIRADHTYDELALILVTAYDDQSLGNEAIENGFTAYFTKPVRQSQLFDCIMNVVGKAIVETGVQQPVDTGAQTDLPRARFPSKGGAREKTEISAQIQSQDLPRARFPGKQAPAPVAVSSQKSSQTSSQNLPVLVVDDNQINRQVAEILLTEMGFKVDLAENGRIAVDKVAGNAYGVIFLDCQMPEMDGFDAARAIRQMEQGSPRRVPIVAMTAESWDTARDACLAAGMDDFIMKPVDPEKLKKVASSWIGRADQSITGGLPTQAPAARASSSSLPAQPPPPPPPGVRTTGSSLPAQPPPPPGVRTTGSSLPAQPPPPPGARVTRNSMPAQPPPPPGTRTTGTSMPAQQVPAPAPASAQASQNEERLLNMAALRERFADDEIKMLFGIVEDSLGGELKKLREGLARNDDKVVASVAHAFKGASMSIEATTLYELLYELEKAAKASDSARFAGLAEKIEMAYTETIEVIRRYK